LRLLQILRRHRRPVTAQVIAAELEVSVRTVYRDIASLQADRVPVRGEAGLGYVLEAGFDLPPLMFDANEIEAVILGLRWVQRRGDRALSRSARDVVAKIGAVLPARLKPLLFDATLLVPPPRNTAAEGIDAGQLREAIRLGRKLWLRYRNEAGRETERTVWPLALSYFENVQLLIGWCELREGFRHFRTDRMGEIRVLPDAYPARRLTLLKQWQNELRRSSGAQSIEVLA
jgi:predicted DNA-binding transcriptional regulator YafY